MERIIDDTNPHLNNKAHPMTFKLINVVSSVSILISPPSAAEWVNTATAMINVASSSWDPATNTFAYGAPLKSTYSNTPVPLLNPGLYGRLTTTLYHDMDGTVLRARDDTGAVCDGPYTQTGDMTPPTVTFSLNGSSMTMSHTGGPYSIATVCSNGDTVVTSTLQTASPVTVCGGTTFSQSRITAVGNGDKIYACRNIHTNILRIPGTPRTVTGTVTVQGTKYLSMTTNQYTYSVGTGAQFANPVVTAPVTTLDEVTVTFPYTLQSASTRVSVGTNSPNTTALIYQCDTKSYAGVTNAHCNDAHVKMTVQPRGWGIITGLATVTTTYD